MSTAISYYKKQYCYKEMWGDQEVTINVYEPGDEKFSLAREHRIAMHRYKENLSLSPYHQQLVNAFFAEEEEERLAEEKINTLFKGVVCRAIDGLLEEEEEGEDDE